MRGLRLVTLAAISVLVFSACNAAATPSPSVSVPGSAAPSAAKGGVVRWFVGLGSGTKPNQIDAQKAFVENYNKVNKDGITIKLEIVPYASAYDVLKSEMAAGNTPDIVGPVGVQRRNGFEGLFLDLSDEIKKNNYNLKDFPDALVNFCTPATSGTTRTLSPRPVSPTFPPRLAISIRARPGTGMRLPGSPLN
jgi:ABC-type glycerol-3-phosphate transport system substrate-binding protein